MNYHEAANFLFDLQRYRFQPGTESTAALLSFLGNPESSTRFVQVTGSNGKGSTARMTESILRDTDLTVGLYTSPHFDDVRERIRVDGRKIPQAAVRAFVDRVEEYVVDRAADGASPTFFETMTALALWQFDREDVDVAVLEVGIGGRLDATSVVDPEASAVTSVALEHTDLLGDTVAEIARDKAHVAPADGPLVTGTSGEALSAVREVAGEVVTVGPEPDAGGSADRGGDAGEAERPDVTVAYGGRVNHTESAVTVDGPDYRVETRVPTVGSFQAVNAGIAAELARAVASVDEATVARGLRNAHWPGRFEVVSESPMVVLDGAHNPEACEALAASLGEFDYDDLHVVFGAMHDKDHRGMVAALPTPDAVTTCRPNVDRAADEDVLATVFERTGVEDVTATNSVARAVTRRLDAADPGDCVLVCGSLYTVAEARSRWTRADVPKDVDTLADARRTLETATVTPPGVWRMRGKAVHRVVRTRVQQRQASYLKEEMLSLGGECAVSGLRHDAELHDVVLMGTLSQFKRLATKLEGQPWGLESLGQDLRERVGIGESTVETSGHDYPWDDGTAVMGILNITPDSFHDGGEYNRLTDARERAARMVDAGADVLDVGGESTRPGADPVSVEEEIDRVVPVIEAISGLDAMVSVDTRKAAVAEAALDAGADVLNDVSGLEDPEMRFLAADYDVPIVVMHSIDTPVDPANEIEYDDVVEDVIDNLTEQVLLAEKAGLSRDQILVDPGLGFGKTAGESFELLDRLGELRALDCPILVGHSHKSMFAQAGADTGDCIEHTIAGTVLAVERGADVVRVHDVPENVAAVRTAEATEGAHDEQE